MPMPESIKGDGCKVSANHRLQILQLRPTKSSAQHSSRVSTSILTRFDPFVRPIDHSMDQPNVTTRQQKKIGHGKEQPTGGQAPAESAAGVGEEPTGQSTYLAGFSAEQVQNLTTFKSNAITNAIDPM